MSKYYVILKNVITGENRLSVQKTSVLFLTTTTNLYKKTENKTNVSIYERIYELNVSWEIKRHNKKGQHPYLPIFKLLTLDLRLSKCNRKIFTYYTTYTQSKGNKAAKDKVTVNFHINQLCKAHILLSSVIINRLQETKLTSL